MVVVFVWSDVYIVSGLVVWWCGGFGYCSLFLSVFMFFGVCDVVDWYFEICYEVDIFVFDVYVEVLGDFVFFVFWNVFWYGELYWNCCLGGFVNELFGWYCLLFLLE